MKTEMNHLNCGRETDLVDFLYGELEPMAKRNFQLHMQDCADCGSQLSAFKDIRESVVSWRDESLGAFSSSFEHPAVARIERQKPSAIAAVREFFNLSPLWLKGTVAFASLLFCLFTVLAATRLMETTPETTVANNTAGQAPSVEVLNSEVERRVKEELQRREAANKPQTMVGTTDSPVDEAVRRHSRRQNLFASGSPQRKAARPLSRVEREELAADLRLIVDDGDGQLVLIGDRINQ